MENKLIAVVTGGTGFVGSHLVDLLISEGFKVRCITRKTSDLRWLNGKKVEIYDCGLFDKEKLKDVLNNADYIYHVAGVVKSIKPEGYFKGNVETTKNLLDVAVEVSPNLKRFVVISSQTATGPSLDEIPVNEKSECRPITTYGRSKLEEEKLANSYMDKIPITICRAPAVYGERDTEILIYFKTFNKGVTTKIGFDQKKVSLIHVIDLVNGIYKSSISEKAKGETYFISSEKFYNWDEIGKVTSKVLNKKPISIKFPHFMVFTIAAISQFVSFLSNKAATLNIEKAKDITQKNWICDTSKAIKDFDYKQNISIEKGIKQTCDWYNEMKWI
ncbi:MAG: NAD(P)-dependent oxidoreductase [Ignavibacteriales bacterium CG_4_9_14_3_um_filter_30_11]|nr:MAG: NAD(P)-dependent oxidoreductase [Ignavibacteriales bacterium CG_4_9_14_3_um_filter_30_11]